MKDLITSAPVLTYYKPQENLILGNDACQYGIRVVYASRSLSKGVRRYAQIEKEMLAKVYGQEKFHQYTYGRHMKILKDHKPLLSICEKPSRASQKLQNLPMLA